MSVRARLLALSESSGIPFETLRGRWKRGWRGGELTVGKGTQVLRGRAKPEVMMKPRPVAVRARAPEFFFEDSEFWNMQ